MLVYMTFSYVTLEMYDAGLSDVSLHDSKLGGVSQHDDFLLDVRLCNVKLVM